MSPLRVGKLIVRGGESVGKYEHWGGKMSKIFIQFIYLVKRVEYLNSLSNGETQRLLVHISEIPSPSYNFSLFTVDLRSCAILSIQHFTLTLL